MDRVGIADIREQQEFQEAGIPDSWHRWISAGRLDEHWLPQALAPEFDIIENTIAAGGLDLRRLADLVTVGALAKAEGNPRWVAAPSHGSIEIREVSASADRTSDQTLLPDHALVLLINSLAGVQCEYWDSAAYSGGGLAERGVIVLEGKPGTDLEELAYELRSSKFVNLQVRRLILLRSGRPTVEDLLGIHIDLDDIRRRGIVPGESRVRAKATQLLGRVLAARKSGRETPREFVVTGVTLEQRLEQFEAYVLNEPWVDRSFSFVVEVEVASTASIRPLGPSALPASSAETYSIDSETWSAWLHDPSRNWNLFNSLFGVQDLPTEIFQKITATVGLPFQLPPFSMYRQLHRAAWDFHGILDAEDWEYLIRNLAVAGKATATGDSTTITKLRAAYRPVLALKAALPDKVLSVYLLSGPDQADDPIQAHTFLEGVAERLGEALNRSLHYSAEMARLESVRRLAWLLHCIAGPLGNGSSAAADIQSFLKAHGEVAEMLAPNGETAARRARIPGREIAESRLDRRFEVITRSLADIRQLAERLGHFQTLLMGFSRKPLDMAELLTSVVEERSKGFPELEAEKIEFASASVIEGDAEALRYALAEVISNAFRELRYRAVSAPRIRFWVRSSSTAVEIGIQDNALPVGEDLVFDPFREQTSAHHAHGSGTGMGLPMVREIITLHGGTCQLSTNRHAEGQRVSGMTFYAVFPRWKGNESDAEQAQVHHR